MPHKVLESQEQLSKCLVVHPLPGHPGITGTIIVQVSGVSGCPQDILWTSWHNGWVSYWFCWLTYTYCLQQICCACLPQRRSTSLPEMLLTSWTKDHGLPAVWKQNQHLMRFTDLTLDRFLAFSHLDMSTAGVMPSSSGRSMGQQEAAGIRWRRNCSGCRGFDINLFSYNQTVSSMQNCLRLTMR